MGAYLHTKIITYTRAFKCMTPFGNINSVLITTYLHLGLVSRGSWGLPPVGQRQLLQLSLVVLLELREGQAL